MVEQTAVNRQVTGSSPVCAVYTTLSFINIRDTGIFNDNREEISMSGHENDNDDLYINDAGSVDEFDFVSAYNAVDEPGDSMLLPDNTAESAISCAFIGIGGGGGKLAKAFLDMGFNKTMLVNTTEKDQPDGVPPDHFLLIPGADGVGKDVTLGKEILEDNSALVEDTVRTRLGQVDWIFVLAGGGGGTGSACPVLHDTLVRYLSTIGASGKIVYIISRPSSQELLNTTIEKNFVSVARDVAEYPHIIIDNERQLQLLRNKVGMLNLYPVANKNFAKLLAQILKLASTHSDIQAFDTKDLETCLNTDGRIVIGSTIITDTSRRELGARAGQSWTSAGKSKVGGHLNQAFRANSVYPRLLP